jgi:transcriptional regulator with XRE-family HTH domain
MGPKRDYAARAKATEAAARVLRARCRAKGVTTPAQLAAACGLTDSSTGRVWNGDVAPGARFLAGIAALLGEDEATLRALWHPPVDTSRDGWVRRRTSSGGQLWHKVVSRTADGYECACGKHWPAAECETRRMPAERCIAQSCATSPDPASVSVASLTARSTVPWAHRG